MSAHREIKLPLFEGRSQRWWMFTFRRRTFGIYFGLCFIFSLLAIILLGRPSRLVKLVPYISLNAPDVYHASALEKMFPVADPNRSDDYHDANRRAMHALVSCIATHSCAQNQTDVIIFGSSYYAETLEGILSGERVWAKSTIDSLTDMGYTLLYTKSSNEHVALLYAQFPQLVKAIVMSPDKLEDCLGSASCIKSVENPLGIPLWKMFAFNFWNSAEHPLGGAWTISPEDWPRIHPDGKGKDNFYVGYSVERACHIRHVIPASERPGHVYIFGKLYKFFTPDEDYAWEGIDFPSLGFSAVAGVILDSGVPLPDDMPLPGGITNLGRLNQSAFLNAIGSSRAVLGVGNPQTSPTAYDALCLGVPFVNPVTGWAEEDPEDRTRWYVQHEGLKFEREPYVYHVRRGDVNGLRRAIRKAYETPIDRYIPERMREDAVKARLGDLLNHDWRARAARILEERKQAGNTQLFVL